MLHHLISRLYHIIWGNGVNLRVLITCSETFQPVGILSIFSLFRIGIWRESDVKGLKHIKT